MRDAVPLPDAALDDRWAIVGTSGAGKTYAARGMMERLLRADATVCWVDALDGYAIVDTRGLERERAALHWVICGGESGNGARPMHPDWARSLRDQCAAAGVPFFMKQLSSGGPKAIKEIDAFPDDLRVREFPA